MPLWEFTSFSKDEGFALEARNETEWCQGVCQFIFMDGEARATLKTEQILGEGKMNDN